MRSTRTGISGWENSPWRASFGPAGLAKELGDAEIVLANLFALGLLTWGEKLGLLLWQFPPRMAI